MASNKYEIRHFNHYKQKPTTQEILSFSENKLKYNLSRGITMFKSYQHENISVN
ncbi:hypothetical protein CoNPh26_CDS0175 [Staphylococcus phage S-CoN_Ph26]|nr:hypothetical protein CoNPh26_CDS0175 [Staphylococcus phage S-CoN_Ph26]